MLAVCAHRVSIYLSYLSKVLHSFHLSNLFSMVWPQRHGCISNPKPSMLHHYRLLNMDCFIRNLSTSILPLWERQLYFHTSPWQTRGGLSPFLHPIPIFPRSISRNGIVNGKDALLLAHLNGTSVDVSDLEGTRFTPFFRIIMITFFII